MPLIAAIPISILSGLILVWGSHEIGSTFIMDFLRANLLLLLPALSAINVTTIGVVITKLSELSEKHPDANFAKTIESMRQSFREQVGLMIVTAVLLIIEGSHSCPLFQIGAELRHDARFFVESLICACFVYSLIILYDTAMSIFVIADFENK